MKVLLFLAALLCSAWSALGASCTLAWDNPNPPGTVAGYTIYQRVLGGAYVRGLEIVGETNTFGTVTNLALGTTYFFVVTCYDTNGLESAYSGEVSIALPNKPDPPINLHTNELRLKAKLQESRDPHGPWVNIHEFPDQVILGFNQEARFYKLSLELLRE